MRSERGSMVVESLLIVPSLMVLTLLVLHAGTTMHTSMELRSVAGLAARRASQVPVERSVRAAETTATRELRLRGISCAHRNVSAQVTQRAGSGHLVVRLACRLPTANLGLLRVQGRTVTVVADSVFDRYRRS